MRYVIKHDIKNRIRVKVLDHKLSANDADAIVYNLEQLNNIYKIRVNDKTNSIVIDYRSSRDKIINLLAKLNISTLALPEVIEEMSSRALNEYYKEKLMMQVMVRYIMKTFVPAPIRTILTLVRALPFIIEGLKAMAKRKIEVAILDAIAISVSLVMKDFKTASSIMFMLGIGETLEEWTHKKSVNDLARSLSLNITKAWLVVDKVPVLVDSSDIKPNDIVYVATSNVIPFDGEVESGEAYLNQTSLTGESKPVYKKEGKRVYAGTVVEEGELYIRVMESAGQSRFEKISIAIEENEKLKSVQESKAEHLADRLVPYTLLGTGLTYALTRNVTKALAVLMVDYSCALKLAMPVTVLSAMREANQHGITIKGGIYLENMQEATTIVFDKTGTITKAFPQVVETISFNGEDSDELLRIAACLEEHFPHSMANAVVKAADEKGLDHEEMHSKVKYVVAHGIKSSIDGKDVVIGSNHFVFEDEKAQILEQYQEKFDNLPKEYSHLYLAVDGVLAAVICVEDPIRQEAKETIASLKALGFKKVVMMTGDSKHIATNIANKVGIDEYYAEVLPEDKEKYINECKANGEIVVMVGDGINDSPALSAAHVGIAISDGAEIAREVSDITIAADDLRELVTLKVLSNRLMQRVSRNYKAIIGINTALIGAGVLGVIQPTTSAFLHNASTIATTVDSMKSYLPEQHELLEN